MCIYLEIKGCFVDCHALNPELEVGLAVKPVDGKRGLAQILRKEISAGKK